MDALNKLIIATHEGIKVYDVPSIVNNPTEYRTDGLKKLRTAHYRFMQSAKAQLNRNELLNRFKENEKLFVQSRMLFYYPSEIFQLGAITQRETEDVKAFSELDEFIHDNAEAILKVEKLETYSLSLTHKLNELVESLRDNELELNLGAIFQEYNKFIPTTIHAFYGNAKADSFPLHKDTANVILITLNGTKTLKIAIEENNKKIIQSFEIDDKTLVIMQSGVEHQLIHDTQSDMLSIGIERYLKNLM